MANSFGTEDAIILKYQPDQLGNVQRLIAELQDSLKEIEPEIISSGQKVKESYTEALLGKIETQNGKLFLAHRKGTAVGLVAVYIVTERDEDVEYLYVSDLVVTKNARGKGIGKALLERAERYALEKNLGYMRIGSLVVNEGASRLYRNFGFKEYLTVLQKKLSR